MRIAVCFVGAHGPAEHDETVVATDRDVGIVAPMEVDVADPETRVLEHRVENAERLERDVLEDEKLTHRCLV